MAKGKKVHGRVTSSVSDRGWTEEELLFLEKFRDPWSVQVYLDSIEYNPSYDCRSPRWVIRKGSAHCFEGALFAAAVLRQLGHKPLIVDMRAENDDDHVIAVFRKGDRLGAVAKSNFTSLRYREPVYRSLRELVMSYFDFFFNTNGFKSLRSYSRTLDLSQFDKWNWHVTDEDLQYIGDKLDSIHHFPVITRRMAGELSPASKSMLMAGLLGSNEEGLFKPTI